MKISEETLKRAARTFIQTAAGYAAVNVVTVDFSAEKKLIKSALLGLAVSAISAGLSAVMNVERCKKTDDDSEVK